jgi:phosphohistidine phosphatase SixA
MKKLILVRHGQYDNSSHLTENGREQIKMLATKLKIYIDNDMSISVLASPTYRTQESADIISKIFNIKFEIKNELLSEGFAHAMNLSRAYNLIKSKDGVDIVILVTHFDYVADLPKYFSEKEWGIKLPSVEIGKGEAWVVDCLQRTLTLVN